jgi:hypothetical protein
MSKIIIGISKGEVKCKQSAIVLYRSLFGMTYRPLTLALPLTSTALRSKGI